MAQTYPQPKFHPPAGATDLLLIRHGRSEPARPDVPFPLKDGHGDPALAPEGRTQAKQLAARLRSWPIDALYVTSLRRTHQTAAPLAKALGLVPTEEPELREVHLGDWDGGLYRKKAAEGDAAFLKARADHEWGAIPGAETTAALQARVGAALARIAAGHPDQLVAAVVHGGVIGAAMALATGARGFAFNGADNGSISRIVLHKGAMIVRGFNDGEHLRDL